MKYTILSLALLLGACGGLPVPPTPSPTQPTSLQSLATFTVADLTAASKDAKAQPDGPGCAQGTGDCTAWPCYDFLAGLVGSLPGTQPNQTVGVALAFQKARDLVNGISGISGPLANLNRACAPLVIDTQSTINKLILIGAGAAATGGAVAPIVGPLIP